MEKLVTHKPIEHSVSEHERSVALRKLNDALAKNRAKNAVDDAACAEIEISKK